MELTGLFPIIRRWLAVIVAATAMAAFVGFILGATADKTYEAEATMLVGPLSSDSNTIRASGDLAQTYAQLATAASNLTPVARTYQLSTSELSSAVRVTANSTTRLLVIKARSTDAETASKIANSMALQLVAFGNQDPTRPEGALRTVDLASIPDSPVSPRLDLIIPLATIAGLLGSMTLVLLFEFIGDTAESTEKVEAATGLTTLAVKRQGGWPATRRTGQGDPARVVATQAELSAPDVECILLTGVVRDDGTGALALELADIMGERHRSVTLIDAGAGEVTELTGGVGDVELSDVLTSGRIGEVLQRRSEHVQVIPVGPGERSEGVELGEAQDLIRHLTRDGGLVLIHGLPATLSAATLVWAQAADVTILVVRRFQARRSAIAETATNLRIVGAQLGFAVLHDAPRPPWRRPALLKPETGAGRGAGRSGRDDRDDRPPPPDDDPGTSAGPRRAKDESAKKRRTPIATWGRLATWGRSA